MQRLARLEQMSSRIGNTLRAKQTETRSDALPRTSCQQTVGPSSDEHFPRFVERQQAQPEARRKEEVFDGNSACAQRVLKSWHVQPERSHDEGEGNRGEEIQVLSVLIETWRMMEDGETACAERHQIEPLPGLSVLNDMSRTVV